MKRSLQVIYLLGLIYLLELRCYGTEAAHFHPDHRADHRGHGDLENYYHKVKLPNTCGCNNHVDGDYRSGAYRKIENEILIENNKHFHDHNNNYVLVPLVKGKGQTYIYDTPDPKIKVNEQENPDVHSITPCQRKLQSGVIRNDLKDGRKQDLKPYMSRTPTTADERGFNDGLDDTLKDGRKVLLKPSTYRTRAFKDGRGFDDELGDAPINGRKGNVKANSYKTRAFKDGRANDDGLDDPLKYGPKGELKTTSYRTRALEDQRRLDDELDYEPDANYDTDNLRNYDYLV